LTEIYRLIAPYTIHTHIKDGIGTKENYQRKVLGEGEIPIIEAIKILNENNYKGVWCIEYEGENKEIGYKKCVEFLKKLEI
jgi:sugar phosphate isomerase/epimerase